MVENIPEKYIDVDWCLITKKRRIIGQIYKGIRSPTTNEYLPDQPFQIMEEMSFEEYLESCRSLGYEPSQKVLAQPQSYYVYVISID
jgi:hypothetical protein